MACKKVHFAVVGKVFGKSLIFYLLKTIHKSPGIGVKGWAEEKFTTGQVGLCASGLEGSGGSRRRPSGQSDKPG